MYPGYKTASDGEAPVLELSAVWSNYFGAITLKSTLTWSGRIY